MLAELRVEVDRKRSMIVEEISWEVNAWVHDGQHGETRCEMRFRGTGILCRQATDAAQVEAARVV
jgi:hypothetical protein